MAPTFVVIPGAWHPKEAGTPLVKSLESLSYPVHSHQLASVGAHGPSATAEADVSALRKDLDPLLDQGLDLIIVAHSYAGFPTAGACKDIAKKHRAAAGKKGGVIGVVYMAAFVAPAGVTLLQMLGGSFPPWILLDEEKGDIGVDGPDHVFYADVDKDEAERCKALLKRHSLISFKSPVAEAGYKDAAYNGRRAYIFCEDDNAIPHAVQQLMVTGSGVEWESKTMKASHSPFLSKPDEVAEYLVSLAKKWEN